MPSSANSKEILSIRKIRSELIWLKNSGKCTCTCVGKMYVIRISTFCRYANWMQSSGGTKLVRSVRFIRCKGISEISAWASIGKEVHRQIKSQNNWVVWDETKTHINAKSINIGVHALNNTTDSSPFVFAMLFSVLCVNALDETNVKSICYLQISLIPNYSDNLMMYSYWAH